MTEVGRRISFGDSSLHKPEFLDIHEVLQAASQPSIEQFKRTLHNLNAANHDRFVLLREVAREQASGSGDSDLRRMKRQFASLKNTFKLYDVKQSFIEGLMEGCPDGTEESQMAEINVAAEKFGAEVKQLKVRNTQTQGEIEELINTVCATYKDFSQTHAVIVSHIECLETEAVQQDKDMRGLEAVPDLPEGPDEATCKAVLDNDSKQTTRLESIIASQQAEVDELIAAIESEEEGLKSLQLQIQELEMDKSEEITQEVSIKFADAAAWCDEMSALMSTLSGITLLTAEKGRISLQLTTSLQFPLSFGINSMQHSLGIDLDPTRGAIDSATLEPKDIELDDILLVPHPQKLNFLIREIQARLAEHLSKAARDAELEGAKKQFGLAEGESAETFLLKTASEHTATIHVPRHWPAGTEAPSLLAVHSASGLKMPEDKWQDLESEARKWSATSLMFLLRQLSNL